MIGVTGSYGTFGAKRHISSAEEFADMKRFLDKYKVDHPVVYEDRANFADYGVTGIPEFVPTGKYGLVRKIQAGCDKASFAEFRRAVEVATRVGS